MTNILLIDDEVGPAQSFLVLLRRHFRDKGIVVYQCTTVEQGLKLTSHRHVQLVLLDLGLNGMQDPMETIGEIPKFPESCLIMAYTAHDYDEVVQAAMNAGAIDFISKGEPVNARLEKIEEVIKNITAAKVRIKVDRSQGTMMTTMGALKQFPVLVGTLLTCLTIGGIVLGSVKGYGAGKEEAGIEKERTNQRFSALTDDVTKLQRSEEERAKWRTRMEKNIIRLLEKNGIQPARDGE